MIHSVLPCNYSQRIPLATNAVHHHHITSQRPCIHSQLCGRLQDTLQNYQGLHLISLHCRSSLWRPFSAPSRPERPSPNPNMFCALSSPAAPFGFRRIVAHKPPSSSSPSPRKNDRLHPGISQTVGGNS